VKASGNLGSSRSQRGDKIEIQPGWRAVLAAVQNDQQVRLWDLRLIREELAQMQLDWDNATLSCAREIPGLKSGHNSSGTRDPTAKD